MAEDFFTYLIDFDDSGSFIGPGNIVTLKVDGEIDTSFSRGKSRIQQFAPTEIGTLEGLVLFNADKAYSAEKPGHLVRIATQGKEMGSLELEGGGGIELEGGGTLALEDIPARVLWSGITKKTILHNQRAYLRAEFPALDMMSRLVRKVISTQLYQNKRIDELLNVLLDEAGWPADKRILDEAEITLEWWWLTAEDAFQAAEVLKLTEGPMAHIDTDPEGNFIFHNRSHWVTSGRSTLIQDTYDDDDSRCQAFEPDYSDQDLIQACGITVTKRAAQALASIYQHGTDVVLAASETKRIKIKTSDPFINPVEPSAVGANEQQLLTPTAPLTSGSGIFNINGTDTSAIQWNDSLATIQSAADTAVGVGNTLWTGSLANGLRVQFTGDLAGKSISLIEVKSSFNTGVAPGAIDIQDATDGGNQKYIMKARSPLSAGTFKIRSLNGNTTTAINFDASDNTIQLRLIALPILVTGDAVVSGGDIDTDALTIEYQGALAGQFVPTSIEEAASLRTATASTATLTVTRTVAGGPPDYMVSAGGIASISIEGVKAQSLTLVIVADSSGLTLTGLQVRAQSVTVIRTTEILIPDDTILPDAQIYRPQVRAELSEDDAEANGQAYVDRYGVERRRGIVRLLSARGEPAILDSILVRQAGDLVWVQDEQSMVDEAFYVLRAKTIIRNKRVEVELGVEEAA